MTRQIRKAEAELKELKSLREKELEEFRGISEEWIKREKDYRAEIKRLELILAKESNDGVASVALARHGSLVNRSDSRRFQAQVKRVGDSRDQGMLYASLPFTANLLANIGSADGLASSIASKGGDEELSDPTEAPRNERSVGT